MKTLTNSVVLPCARDTFWKIYLDPEYVKALYLGELGYRGLEVLEATQSTRKLRVTPKVNLPGPVEKLIGDSFTYEDHGTLDRTTHVWTWSMVQPKPPPGGKARSSVVTTRGTVRVDAIGENQCRRTDELVIEGHVFGLGGIIESSAEKETRAAWAKEYPFLERWIAKNAAR